VIISGEPRKDLATYICVCVCVCVCVCIQSPPNSLPSRLPHNIEQSSLCYTVGPCWLSILNTAVWTCYAMLCYAKSLQLCLTLCDPRDGSPPGSPVPRILQAKTLEWVAISSSSAWKWKVKVKSLSHVRLFATPWTAAYQAPPSMGFSRQEYWSGVPLPSPNMNMFIPNSLTIPLPLLPPYTATINSFSKSVSLCRVINFLCIISF